MENLTHILTDLEQELKSLYGIRLYKTILYGSQARREAQYGSDIDILIILHDLRDPGREIKRVGPITSQLSLKYDVVISCVFISKNRFEHDNSPLLLNIRHEGVAL